MKNFPQRIQRFDIESYKRPKNLKELRKTHLPFSGAPHKHPYDPKKIVLVPDPFSSTPHYYEFRSSDISYAEELPNVVDLDGKAIKLARIWVRKMSVGILCSPFIVEEAKTSE